MATRYAKLKPILEPPTGALSTTKLNRSVKDLAETIGKRRVAGRLKLSIKDGRRRHNYAIDLSRDKSSVASDVEGRSDLELTCDKNTYVAMLTGELSPADAFLTGRLGVRGNLGFAKRVYANAARSNLGDLGPLGD